MGSSFPCLTYPEGTDLADARDELDQAVLGAHGTCASHLARGQRQAQCLGEPATASESTNQVWIFLLNQLRLHHATGTR